MPNPLFSSYGTPENRVTASTMAVLERLSLTLVQELFETAADTGAELSTVSFKTLVPGEGSVPDARILANFTWFFETKTKRGSYTAEGNNRDQVRKHALLLTSDPEAHLFVLTPDSVKPGWLDNPDGIDEAVRDRVVWLGFAALTNAMRKLLDDSSRLLDQQVRFLLTELIAFYEADGLLTIADTVIVAAQAAWPEYQEISAYICQPDRTFREDLTHLGFYADRAIQRLIPCIRARYTSVPFTLDEARSRRKSGEDELASLIEHVLGAGTRVEGDAYGVMLLSAKDDPETVPLTHAIENDGASAWVQGQRYARLDQLKSGVTHTSELRPSK